jgi:hypothetical protein
MTKTVIVEHLWGKRQSLYNKRCSMKTGFLQIFLFIFNRICRQVSHSLFFWFRPKIVIYELKKVIYIYSQYEAAHDLYCRLICENKNFHVPRKYISDLKMSKNKYFKLLDCCPTNLNFLLFDLFTYDPLWNFYFNKRFLTIKNIVRRFNCKN